MSSGPIFSFGNSESVELEADAVCRVSMCRVDGYRSPFGRAKVRPRGEFPVCSELVSTWGLTRMMLRRRDDVWEDVH